MSDYTLHHGDCLEVLRTLPDSSVDAVVTDPPYSISSGGRTAMKGIFNQLRNTKIGMSGGIFDLDPKKSQSGLFFHTPDFTEWMPLLYRVMKSDSDIYAMVNAKNMGAMLSALISAGFGFHNILVWDKQGATANRWYMQRCEYIVYGWKGRARTINNPGMSNLISISPKRGGREHPTEKPVRLMQTLIEQSTDPGALVLDPFMGSGATGQGCMASGRRFIGIERDAGYFEIAQERIADAADPLRHMASA